MSSRFCPLKPEAFDEAARLFPARLQGKARAFLWAVLTHVRQRPDERLKRGQAHVTAAALSQWSGLSTQTVRTLTAHAQRLDVFHIERHGRNGSTLTVPNLCTFVQDRRTAPKPPVAPPVRRAPRPIRPHTPRPEAPPMIAPTSEKETNPNDVSYALLQEWNRLFPETKHAGNAMMDQHALRQLVTQYEVPPQEVRDVFGYIKKNRKLRFFPRPYKLTKHTDQGNGILGFFHLKISMHEEAQDQRERKHRPDFARNQNEEPQGVVLEKARW